MTELPLSFNCADCIEFNKQIPLIKRECQIKCNALTIDNNILRHQIEKLLSNNNEITDYLAIINNLKENINLLMRTNESHVRKIEELNKTLKDSRNICTSCHKPIKELQDKVIHSKFFICGTDSDKQPTTNNSMASICKKYLKLETALDRERKWSESIKNSYMDLNKLTEAVKAENIRLNTKIDSLMLVIKELKQSHEVSKVESATNLKQSNNSDHDETIDKNLKLKNKINKKLSKMSFVKDNDVIITRCKVLLNEIIDLPNDEFDLIVFESDLVVSSSEHNPKKKEMINDSLNWKIPSPVSDIKEHTKNDTASNSRKIETGKESISSSLDIEVGFKDDEGNCELPKVTDMSIENGANKFDKDSMNLSSSILNRKKNIKRKKAISLLVAELQEADNVKRMKKLHQLTNVGIQSKESGINNLEGYEIVNLTCGKVCEDTRRKSSTDPDLTLSSRNDSQSNFSVPGMVLNPAKSNATPLADVSFDYLTLLSEQREVSDKIELNNPESEIVQVSRKVDHSNCVSEANFVTKTDAIISPDDLELIRSKDRSSIELDEINVNDIDWSVDYLIDIGATVASNTKSLRQTKQKRHRKRYQDKSVLKFLEGSPKIDRKNIEMYKEFRALFNRKTLTPSDEVNIKDLGFVLQQTGFLKRNNSAKKRRRKKFNNFEHQFELIIENIVQKKASAKCEFERFFSRLPHVEEIFERFCVAFWQSFSQIKGDQNVDDWLEMADFLIPKLMTQNCEQDCGWEIFETIAIVSMLRIELGNEDDARWLCTALGVVLAVCRAIKEESRLVAFIMDVLLFTNVPMAFVVSSLDKGRFLDYSDPLLLDVHCNWFIGCLRLLFQLEYRRGLPCTMSPNISENGLLFWLHGLIQFQETDLCSLLRDRLVIDPSILDFVNCLFGVFKRRFVN